MNKTTVLALFAILAGGLLQFAKAEAPVAVVKGGNVVLQTSQGGSKQLTTSGRDARPVVSPDGKWVVFVRSIPGKQISTGSGDVDAEELWQIGADGKDEIKLVAPREAKEVSDLIANFTGLQFSADGRLVYFITPAWATSGAVHVVDTTNRKVRFIVPGNDLKVIHSGEYIDCLLVMQHRYFLGGGSYDWYWLFKSDGKEIGPVGEDTANFDDLYRPAAKGAGPAR